MIYLYLADGFEEVEALTPLDYLRRCKELAVMTVGVTGQQVRGAHDITVSCDLTPDQVRLSETEMMILPGGMPGTNNLEQSDAVKATIDYCAKNDRWIAAICAAPSILGHMGLLAGRSATCFPGYENELKGAHVTGQPVEIDGRLITARGAGVANQFAFALIASLLGQNRADELKAAIQWAE